jgi:hypothetical protein
LAELQHQRALVREHLAWLEREIADHERDSIPPSPAPAVVPAVASVPAQLPMPELGAYSPDPVTAAQQTRRGCFVMLAVIVVLILTAFFAVYWLRYRDRPLLFSMAPNENSVPSHR